MRKNVYILIPGAGSSSRMGGGINKQLLKIQGLPTIIRTISLFNSLTEVSGICIIAAENDIEAMQNLCRQYDLFKNISFTEGGATRQHSVLNGLRKLSSVYNPQDDDIVLVHDGARCLVTADVVKRCIHDIDKYNLACAAAMPVKDTIKQIKPPAAGDSAAVDRTLDRSLLWGMQTPQGAPFRSLIEAYEAVTARNELVTDDLAVMEAQGHPTRLTKGDYRNIKLTTPEDIQLAEALLKLD